VNDPILFDYKNIDGEDRWTGMGSTDMLRVLVVAFTIREGRIRAVTAITASKKRVRSSGSRNVIKMPIRRKKKEGLVVPRFTSRHADAEWFDKNRRKLEADMSRRLATRDTTTLARALAQSAANEKAKLKPVTIRMLPDDLETLRRVAAEKGLPYQTYLKVLLREALRGNQHQ